MLHWEGVLALLAFALTALPGGIVGGLVDAAIGHVLPRVAAIPLRLFLALLALIAFYMAA